MMAKAKYLLFSMFVVGVVTSTAFLTIGNIQENKTLKKHFVSKAKIKSKENSSVIDNENIIVIVEDENKAVPLAFPGKNQQNNYNKNLITGVFISLPILAISTVCLTSRKILRRNKGIATNVFLNENPESESIFNEEGDSDEENHPFFILL